MTMKLKSALHYFSQKPGALFLLDGLGAALTALSLFFVLRPYCNAIGMPVNILSYLSLISLCYCAYSMSCYFLLKNRWTGFLRIIGFGNLLYCLLTMTFLTIYHKDLTPLGLIYFSGEILIILSLVYIELSVAKLIRTRKGNF